MKGIYLLLGGLSFALGGLGVFLPVLPTVPLWLLSVYCFGRACPVLAERLEASAPYQKFVGDSLKRGGLLRGQKIKILLLSTSMMMFAFISVPNTVMRITILILLAVKFYIFFTKIPTLKEVPKS